MVRVNPNGDTPTSVDFRRAQDNTEQALKQLADVSLTWIDIEGAGLFSTSFVNYANGREKASFSMDRSGRVQLRGCVTPALAYITPFPVPALILSLPAENAPVKDRSYVVDCSGAFGVVRVYGRFGSTPQKAGQVYLVVGNDPGQLSLDGVSFEAGA